jgi:hypothetical protein
MTLLIISTYLGGQTWVKVRVNTPVVASPARNFVAFSKIQLNTAKSANIKVIRLLRDKTAFIIGGIGDLEWRLLKNWLNAGMNSVWSQEMWQLGMTFHGDRSDKTPVTLCKYCRWRFPLQLWYLQILKCK